MRTDPDYAAEKETELRNGLNCQAYRDTGTGLSRYAVEVVREKTWELPIEFPGLRYLTGIQVQVWYIKVQVHVDTLERYSYRCIYAQVQVEVYMGTEISRNAVEVVRENTWELPIELPGLRCLPGIQVPVWYIRYRCR